MSLLIKLKLKQDDEVYPSATLTPNIIRTLGNTSQKYRLSRRYQVANSAVRFDHVPTKQLQEDYLNCERDEWLKFALDLELSNRKKNGINL